MVRNRKSRRLLLYGRPPGGLLPHSVLSVCLLFFLPAFSVCCTRQEHPSGQEPPGTDGQEAAAGPVLIRTEAVGGFPVRTLDFFIYRDRGTRPLERHLHFGAGDPPPVLPELTAGEKVLVAVANSPWPFRVGALAFFEAAEQMSMRYDEEDAEAPVLSAVHPFLLPSRSAADTLTLDIRLLPLLCRVEVCSVFRDFPGDERIEGPRVHLQTVNAAAELLRCDGFRPTETLDNPDLLKSPELMRRPLPVDIGFFMQFPAVSLYAYPNDPEEGGLGTPRTRLVLEGRIGGRTCRWESDLPALRRGFRLKTDWTVTGPFSAEMHTREEKEE